MNDSSRTTHDAPPLPAGTGFFKRMLLSMISWYCTVSPVEPGKTRLQRLGLRMLGGKKVDAVSRDGLRFLLSFPEDKGWDHIRFRRTYETGTLDLLKKLVAPDDVVLDIGANIGWYSSHLSQLAPRGHIWAFEPMPPTLERLHHNLALNRVGENVTVLETALGTEPGELTLHTFEQLGHGHVSASSLGRSDAREWTVPVATLDSVLALHGIDRVDVVKMDVEGGELAVVKGATELLARPNPPIWIVEMNEETARAMGHEPWEVVEAIAAGGDCSLYRIERGWGRLLPMKSTRDYRTGDNAVIVPASRRALWQGRVGV